MLLGISVTSTVALAFSVVGARVGIPATIAAGAGIWLIWGPHQKTRHLTFAVIIGALVLIHLVAVDCMCWRLNKETQNTVSLYRQHPDTVAFVPMTLITDAPWYVLWRPYYGWWATLWHHYYMQCWYEVSPEPICVVPDRLQDFAPKKADKIGSDGFYQYRKLIAGPYGSFDTLSLMADYGRGLRHYRFLRVPFTTPDSLNYAWYHPDEEPLECLLHPVPKFISAH